MPEDERVGGESPQRRKKRGLTEEDRTWIKIAKATGSSIQRAKAETAFSEFVKWTIYFEEEVNAFDPLFWYLAQIAKFSFDIPSRVWGGKGSDTEIKDFLLKFEVAGAPPKEMSEIEKQRHMEKSKAAWGSLMAGARKAISEALKRKKAQDKKPPPEPKSGPRRGAHGRKGK